jgi:hypothetical protein
LNLPLRRLADALAFRRDERVGQLVFGVCPLGDVEVQGRELRQVVIVPLVRHEKADPDVRKKSQSRSDRRHDVGVPGHYHRRVTLAGAAHLQELRRDRHVRLLLLEALDGLPAVDALELLLLEPRQLYLHSGRRQTFKVRLMPDRDLRVYGQEVRGERREVVDGLYLGVAPDGRQVGGAQRTDVEPARTGPAQVVARVLDGMVKVEAVYEESRAVNGGIK